MEKISSFARRCYTQFSNKTQYLNDRLYQDLINAFKDDQNEINSIQTHQKFIQQAEFVQKTEFPSLQESQIKQTSQSAPVPEEQNNQPQTLPINTIIKPQTNQTSNQQKAEQHQEQPIIHSKKSLKLKPNPRMHKFIKQQKMQKQKQKERQLLQKINLQKQLQQKARQLQELKEKQIKKFQLKEKLRKLNQQLDQQKKHLRSKQKQHSFFNEQHQGSASNSRSFLMNPQTSHLIKHKISTTFIQRPSLLQNSQIKSRSDAQFRLNKLRHKQQVYTPVKHQAAFRLIQKMHAEKLRKHEKIVSKMRKKQEREIEEVKKLEQEKIKEKNLKRVRQVLYYTPKPTKMKRVSEQIKVNQFSKEQVSNTNNPEIEKNRKTKKEFFRPQSNKSSSNKVIKKVNHSGQQQQKAKQQMEQQIGLIIPHENQTLYTEEYQKEETFEPMTEEGKQFEEALKRAEDKQQQQNYGKPQEQTDMKEEEYLQDKHEQIVADNQFM